MATNEYKSNYSGEQIDSAVGVVLGDTSSENTNLLTMDDIVNETGPNQNKVMSQASISTALNNLNSEISELRELIQEIQSQL